MEREAAQAAYEALHEKAPWHDGTFTDWAPERSNSHPYHFRHSVTIGVAESDLTPWDEFTTKRDASPLPESAPKGETPGGTQEAAEGHTQGDDSKD